MRSRQTLKTAAASLSTVAFVAATSLAPISPAFAADSANSKPKGWTDASVDCKAIGLAKPPPWTIGVSNYGLTNSWRVQMIAELKAAAAMDSRIKGLVITNADANIA